MISIDGSHGEGGGQILRTSLSLSLVTGQPFQMKKIRARRKKPGLLRQHLTAVKAARQIGNADVEGDSLGSKELTFTPQGVHPGKYHFSVGTAGSAPLVFQTVLPALMLANEPSHLTLEGGTHNLMAPPFDFLKKTFLPLLNRMGPNVSIDLDRPGFFPAGGGRFRATVNPAKKLSPISLLERGIICTHRARVLLSQLPQDIGKRELRLIRRRLSWSEADCSIEVVENSLGPGNVILLELESKDLTVVFSGFGERGVAAERVANIAIDGVRNYLKLDAPVDEHLADQLLLPMALAGDGTFRTGPISMHTRTNIEVIKRFLLVDFAIETMEERLHQIAIVDPASARMA